MEEGDDGGEGGVVVNYVGEVGLAFFAFIFGNGAVGGGEGGGGIDCVEFVLPARGWMDRQLWVRLRVGSVMWLRTYSAKSCVTQSVLSVSSLAMTMILSPLAPSKGGR